MTQRRRWPIPNFIGFVQIESSLPIPFLTRSGNQPIDAASLPTYRIYGPAGTLMQSGTGSAAFLDSKSNISNATNANPIVITSVGHGLQTGNIVTISGVSGNTNANGTFTVTVLTADTFSIPATGNGAYTSGGSWHITGLYTFSAAALSANGYAAGSMYTAIVQGVVSSVNFEDAFTFGVV